AGASASARTATSVARMGLRLRLREPEPLLEQEAHVAVAVLPRGELHVAHADAVLDGHFEAPQARLRERLDLDLLRERHAVAGELELREDLLLEDPHAGLRVLHLHDEEDAAGRREHPVAQLVLRAHRALLEHAEAVPREEVELLALEEAQVLGELV